MAEISPNAAVEKLMISEMDDARVVVISRAPGFTEDQQRDIGARITTALGYAAEWNDGHSLEIEFLVQIETLRDEDEGD